MVSPTEMTMDMHMAGLMYAPSDAVTLMAMLNWTSQSMDHLTRMGGAFQASSSGVGDAGVTAMVRLKGQGAVRAHLNLGVGVPVGSIEQTGPNPMSMGRAVQMPYTMQLGENSRGYRKGHAGEAMGWFAVKATDWISLSVRAMAKRSGNYSGADAAYGNPMMAPTVRSELRGGTRVDLPLGANVYFPDGLLKGHRIAAEWTLPLYQDLNGPQLQTDWTLMVGWQKSFAPLGHGH